MVGASLPLPQRLSSGGRTRVAEGRHRLVDNSDAGINFLRQSSDESAAIVAESQPAIQDHSGVTV